MQPQKRHWLACRMGFGSGVLFKSDNIFYVWETYKLLHYLYRLGEQVHKTCTRLIPVYFYCSCNTLLVNGYRNLQCRELHFSGVCVYFSNSLLLADSWGYMWQRSGCLGSALAVMKKSSKFLPVCLFLHLDIGFEFNAEKIKFSSHVWS